MTQLQIPERFRSFGQRHGLKNVAAMCSAHHKPHKAFNTLCHLALSHCSACFGSGYLFCDSSVSRPCPCVLRSVFKQLLCHYRYICDERSAGGWVRATRTISGGITNWSLPKVEFLVDFERLARKTLTRIQAAIFRNRYVLGLEASAIYQKLGLTKGNYYHELYLMQEALGFAAVTSNPYSFYPLNRYYGKTVRTPQTLSTRRYYAAGREEEF